MKIFASLKIASVALKRNRGRTILTILGVVIGISAVVVVMSAGNALEKYVTGEIDAFGTDFIQIEPKVPNVSKHSSANVTGFIQGVSMTSLKYEDAEAIAKLPNIKIMYAAVFGQAIVQRGNIKKTYNLFGSTENYPKIDSGKIEIGRYFTDEEDKGLARVAVLGSEAKEYLFGQEDALGERIKIGKHNFKVIGVYEERGASFGMNLDEIIAVPLHTTQKIIMGIDHIGYIMTKMEDPEREAETIEEITLLLRDQHNLDSDNPDKDDFSVNGATEMKEMMDTILGGITLLLVALAAISLLVGGVGIMNIMYVSVSERTYEIGLRKAVGATSKNILWQFMLEAVVITFFGGIVGVVFGIVISFLISVVAISQGINFAFIISWPGVILATVFSIGIGMLFGIYPARKAASLDPIEALRYE